MAQGLVQGQHQHGYAQPVPSLAALQASASANLIKPQKTSVSSVSNPASGAPVNMSNLTSLQQSHSERTSMTDEAHAGGHLLLAAAMQKWPQASPKK